MASDDSVHSRLDRIARKERFWLGVTLAGIAIGTIVFFKLYYDTFTFVKAGSEPVRIISTKLVESEYRPARVYVWVETEDGKRHYAATKTYNPVIKVGAVVCATRRVGVRWGNVRYTFDGNQDCLK